MPEEILLMDKITKVYPNGFVANKDVTFSINKGEIHALMGENGAGKSTLMKILFGIEPFEEGRIVLKGKEVRFNGPLDAIANGVGMVHQHFMLVPSLTVAENVVLGMEPKKGGMFDFEEAVRITEEACNKYNLKVDARAKVEDLPVGNKQKVEIVKALVRGAEILILDEPTAVLTPQEARRLFEILKNLKEDGKSVVFISHKLNEVMEISDRISCMRQGQYTGTVNKTETNPTELTKMMIGREVFLNIEKKAGHQGDVVLDVKDVWTSGEKEISKIRGISFDVRAGEIVGIAGIDGNGQSELIEAIAGLRKVEKGNVILGGVDITNKTVKQIRDAGLTHIPEDRNTRGLNRLFSIGENLVEVELKGAPVVKGGIINNAYISERAEEMIKKFDIRPANGTLPTSALSGGNAQKVVVAREVNLGGKLLIASQPTRGVDIGAIESIRSILQDVRDKGLGVLLVSAELEEVMSLSDRIIVMHEGKITGRLTADEADEENIGLLMMGGHDAE